MFRCILMTIATIVTVCTSFTAIGQDTATSAHGWDPSEYQLSMDGPCSVELLKASALLNLRDSGKSKEEASRVLPVEAGPSALIVKSVLEDVYDNPTIAHFPYFVYRNITCMRRHIGKPAPMTLTAVAPQVIACQRRFGVEASDHLISCIQQAVTGEGR